MTAKFCPELYWRLRSGVSQTHHYTLFDWKYSETGIQCVVHYTVLSTQYCKVWPWLGPQFCTGSQNFFSHCISISQGWWLLKLQIRF